MDEAEGDYRMKLDTGRLVKFRWNEKILGVVLFSLLLTWGPYVSDSSPFEGFLPQGQWEIPVLPPAQRNIPQTTLPNPAYPPGRDFANPQTQPNASEEALAQTWAKIEEILYRKYANREEQIKVLLEALKKWAEVYNQGPGARGLWWQAKSPAALALTAQIKMQMAHQFYGPHPQWTERVNLMIEAAIRAGLWEGELPQGFEHLQPVASPPAAPNSPPRIGAHTEDKVEINWEPIAGAKSYDLRILDKDGKEIKVITGLTGTSLGKKASELGMEPGKEYKIQMRGVNEAGVLEWEKVPVSEPFKIEKALKPPERTAKPQTDKSSYKPDEPVRITWQEVKKAESYNVYIYTPDGKEVKKITALKALELVKTAQELGLEPGSYYVRVSAVNKAGEGELSEPSESFQIVPSAVPQPPPPPQPPTSPQPPTPPQPAQSLSPSNLSAQLSPDKTQATVSWQWTGDPNATFELQIAPLGENIENGKRINLDKGKTSYTFAGLTPGAYQVRIRAKEPGKEFSNWTDIVQFRIEPKPEPPPSPPRPPTPVAAPEVPGGLNVEATTDKVRIKWDKVEQANGGYVIEIRNEKDEVVYSYQTVKDAEVTSYEFNPRNIDGQGKKLEPGNYKVRIKAVKEEGGKRVESTWSSYARFTVPAP
jgi:hypothetical protein